MRCPKDLQCSFHAYHCTLHWTHMRVHARTHTHVKIKESSGKDKKEHHVGFTWSMGCYQLLVSRVEKTP